MSELTVDDGKGTLLSDMTPKSTAFKNFTTVIGTIKELIGSVRVVSSSISCPL